MAKKDKQVGSEFKILQVEFIWAKMGLNIHLPLITHNLF